MTNAATQTSTTTTVTYYIHGWAFDMSMRLGSKATLEEARTYMKECARKYNSLWIDEVHGERVVRKYYS